MGVENGFIGGTSTWTKRSACCFGWVRNPGAVLDAHYQPTVTPTSKILQDAGNAFNTGSVTEETNELWNFSRVFVIACLNIHSLLLKHSYGKICIPSYKVYRRDRNRNGGGVVVYVQESLRTPGEEIWITVTSLEVIWLEIWERSQRTGTYWSFLQTGLHPMMLVSWVS